MRRTLLAALALTLAAPSVAAAAVQQVLLPGPTPYPTPSPPLASTGAPPFATLPFRIHARSEQRIVAGVDESGELVSVRALQRLLLTGTGDYLIVVSAPVSDVRAAAGSDSQPGLRRGQFLWSGFSPGRKVLAADAILRPAPVEGFLPLRLSARLDGDRYTLTVTNATGVAQLAFTGKAFRRELARLLDRTRRQSLARRRLTAAYVSIDGLVHGRTQRPRVAAPFAVQGELRFEAPPSSASGGALVDRTVRFAAVLGDASPLSHRVEVRGVAAPPKLRLVARPTNLVRALRPPGGRSWERAVRRRPLRAAALLRRLLDARMQLVRADQYRAFLSNPDAAGRNRTTYVYESASAPRRAAPRHAERDGGTGALVVVLAIGGSLLGVGAALVAWAHS